MEYFNKIINLQRLQKNRRKADLYPPSRFSTLPVNLTLMTCKPHVSTM